MFQLPEGYREIRRIDLRNNRKGLVTVNLIALLLVVCLFFLGTAIEPVRFVIDGLGSLLRMLGVVVAVVAYVFAHELVHGFFIRIFSGKKAKYGFTGPYAYAGSDAYFSRGQYLAIAFAPVVGLGLLFLLLNLCLPRDRFWAVYVLQIFNLSGAAGDFYVSCIVLKMPRDLLVQDEGAMMRLYARAG